TSEPTTTHLSLHVIRHPPHSTLFPYTTLFRSSPAKRSKRPSHGPISSSLSTASPRPRATMSSAFSRDTEIAASAASSSAERRSRSEEHKSELQSRGHPVCRLLLEKKKTKGQPC